MLVVAQCMLPTVLHVNSDPLDLYVCVATLFTQNEYDPHLLLNDLSGDINAKRVVWKLYVHVSACLSFLHS